MTATKKVEASCLILLWSWSLLFKSNCHAFNLQPRWKHHINDARIRGIAGSLFTIPRSPTLIFAASEDDDNDVDDKSGSTVRRKKRTRRKKNTEQLMESSPELLSVEAPPFDDKPMMLEVQDIRDMTRTTRESAGQQTRESAGQQSRSINRSPPSSSSLASPTTSLDAMLDRVLVDVKRMDDDDDGLSNEEDLTVKQKIGKVLSTIVTADFFLVCVFLLWFLLGIFARAVFQDDTIQIAFNSNFQAFVQPALGVLMIGSIAGNFFEEDVEEEGRL